MVKPRVPEGGAIVDDEEISAEEYSATMKKVLKNEYLQIVRKIIQDIRPPENGTVVEIGPGPGWIGIWLARARPDLHVIGIEPSGDMRRVAGTNAESEGVAGNVQYVDGFVENMGMIPDQSADLVISNGSLHHWSDPQQGLQEILRVLKPTGKIYVQDNRRDYGFGGKIIVHVLGPLIAGKMRKYWISSLKASYTPEEVSQFVGQINAPNWVVKSDVIELSIESR
ncbi:MAG TPA: methyltransferase domain-containing protein [Candidatus Lokiarchaeia archaeon]|nr:methyltransferase domain-containing protein [Candidatus Lokiarchaeia archaeon]